jgi:phosphotransferase system HPr (HPr) family protein
MSAVEREIEVTGTQGLHARPAATFAGAATRYASDIRVIRGDREADAKSMLLVLTLDVRQGDRLVLRAEGPDAEDAVDTLAELLRAP